MRDFYRVSDTLFQRKEEGHSLAEATFAGYLSFMEVYGVLDDGKTESGAAHFAAATFIDAVKTFEDAVDMLFRYANPIVGEAEVVKFRVFLVATHRNVDSFAGISDCVVVKVAENGVKERVVAMYRRISGQEDFRRDVAFFDFFRTLFLDFADQFGDVDFR